MKYTGSIFQAFLYVGFVLLILLSLTIVVVAAPTCVPPPSGLVGWWPGDGNANDIVGGDNGTLQGCATFAPGEVGLAFNLPPFSSCNPPYGSGSYVEAPSTPAIDPTARGSLAAWVKFSNTPSDVGHIMQIIGKGNFGNDFDLQAESLGAD